MKIKSFVFQFRVFLLFVLFFIFSFSITNAQNSYSHGAWTIQLNASNKKVNFIKNNHPILQEISVKAKVNNNEIVSSDYSNFTTETSTVNDEFGLLNKFTIHYHESGKPDIFQSFYFQDNSDYFLTDVVVSSPQKIRTNYIAPIYIDSPISFLDKNQNNRFLTIPYDNDGFITYGAFPLTQDSISFEVTSVFNGETQTGLVVGSVDHDTWKSAIRIKTSDHNIINYLECYNGATHQVTRDEVTWEETNSSGEKVTHRHLMEHGSIRDNQLKSTRFFVGFFDDWRDGMEEYGEANAIVTPKRPWDKGVPFGWNSWGGMATHVNYEGVISVSDFVKEHLQSKDFHNDNTVYIGLDSYWDNMNDFELMNFADHCYANGQIPGIYWTPFADWFGWSRQIEGSSYNYSDTWIQANGQDRRQCGAKCMDPTHPGTIERMQYFISKFKSMGFKYIKLDFMVNGSVEADYYYDRYTTTGTQAYNYGMKKFAEFCGDDMFIVLSISPIFPTQYAQARRISCDAWGEMWHTQYMMNSLSYGWWLDRVYAFNDADHLVMGDRTEGENRARMTSGAITGLYMLGDNLSTTGNYIGSKSSQEKAKRYANNEYINDVARLNLSFRPAYGHIQSSVSGAVDLFTAESDTHYYIAYFNYGGSSKADYLDLSSLGFDATNIKSAFECWTKMPATLSNGKLRYSIPGNDARFYQIEKITPTSAPTIQANSIDIKVNTSNRNSVEVESPVELKDLAIYSVDGTSICKKKIKTPSTRCTLRMNNTADGIYIISAYTTNNEHISKLIIIN